MEVYLCRAKMSDMAEILAMSKGIYEGDDYLPHVLPYWLSQPEDERHNLVLKVRGSDRIVGFLSDLYEPGFKRAYLQALRVDKSLQGQGIGAQLQLQHLKHMFEVNIDIITSGSMCTIDWTLEAMEHPIQGTVTSKRSISFVPNVLLPDAASKFCPSSKMRLSSISVERLGRVIRQNEDLRRRIMPHDYIMINWVSYHLDAFDKISTMHTATIVLVDDVEHPRSVGVLSMPYPVPSGGYLGAVDLFVNGHEQELRQHLGELLGLVRDRMGALGATKCKMEFFCEVPQNRLVRSLLKDFGLHVEPGEEHQVWAYETTFQPAPKL